MAWRVAWTEAAIEDLSAAAEYIARDSAHYAGGFAREAFAASDTLTEFANCGRIVPEFKDPTIREISLAGDSTTFKRKALSALTLFRPIWEEGAGASTSLEGCDSGAEMADSVASGVSDWLAAGAPASVWSAWSVRSTMTSGEPAHARV